MSYREVRGCFYSAARENETQSGPSSSETKYVSFRLVHDLEDNPRARFWRSGKPDPVSMSVQSPITLYTRKFFVVGFRLAKEAE